MTIEEHDTVDFVAHDPERDRVLLIMVAEGPWTEEGERLTDLQAKLNVYLAYEETQFREDYPDRVGQPVEIQLRCTEAPGARELEFFQRAVDRVLAPAGITLSWKRIGEEGEHEIEPVGAPNP